MGKTELEEDIIKTLESTFNIIISEHKIALDFIKAQQKNQDNAKKNVIKNQDEEIADSTNENWKRESQNYLSKNNNNIAKQRNIKHHVQ